MEMRRVDRWLVMSLFLVVCTMVALQMFGQDPMTSVLFSCTFPLTGLLWLRTVRRSFTVNDGLILLTMGLTVICLLVDLLRSGDTAGFAYGKKWIMFSMSLLFFQAVSRLRSDRKLRNFVHGAAVCLAGLSCLMFVLRKAEMYTMDGVSSRFLTFGFTNPNLATLFLAMVSMLLWCSGTWYRRCGAGIMAVFVVLTGARNAMLALVLFFICWMFWGRKQKTSRHPGLWAWSPLLFAAAYLLVMRLPQIQQWLQDWTEEGKSLDSRLELWQLARETIARSPLIGAYHGISDGTGISQLHNSHVDIAASYGVPVLILVCILLRRWLCSGENGTIWGFVGALLLGFGEAAVFSGGLGIYIFAGMFLLLAKEDGNENRICQ